MKFIAALNTAGVGFCLVLAQAVYAAAPDAPDNAAPAGPDANVAQQVQAAPASPETPAVNSTEQLDEPRQSISQFAADSLITAKVKAALLAETAISALTISVKTTDGRTTLSGTVDDPAQIDTAVAEAGKVEGVKEVSSDLTVKSD